jgi:hypothetical protein
LLLICDPAAATAAAAAQEGIEVLRDCKVTVVQREKIHVDKVTGVDSTCT